MTEFLLVRHGETDWNRDQRVQGHTDVPLNATGLEQAAALSLELAKAGLVSVYSSDLVRARETALIVARASGLDVTFDPRLREKNFGSWEGLTDMEIADRFPDAIRGRWGDGETTVAVAARVLAAIEEIRLARPSGPVLVVSHGGPVRAFLAHLGLEHGPIGNCEVFRVEY